MSSAVRIDTRPPTNPFQRLALLLRDQRFLRIAGQLIFLALTVYLLSQLVNNITTSLASRNLTPNFDFLSNRAGFEIGGAINYTPNDSYWQAFIVGLRNSLLTIVVSLIGATVLGILGGVFLLSSNWLIRTITKMIVEVLRNIPLLVVIYVMFFVVVLALPSLRESIVFPGDGLLAIRVRVIAYAVLFVLLYRSLSVRQPMRRAFWLTGLISTAAAAEFLFWIAERSPDFGALMGAGAVGRFGVPLFVELLVTAGALVLMTLLRPRAKWAAYVYGLLAGQLVGFLLFYFAALPIGNLIIETTPAFYLNNRGFVFPSAQPTARFAEWMAFVGLGLGLAVFAYIYTLRQTEATGKPYPHFAIAMLILGIFTGSGWLIVSGQPLPSLIPISQSGEMTMMTIEQARTDGLLTPADDLLYAATPVKVELPRRQGLRFGAGETLSPEYVALTLALIIYTAAFIAEIVRAGILAVPRGQLEASRALGFSNSQTLRMVVLPQALRVIIPPLSNQYLNLAKNSSLAIAISFADVYQVMNTVINQSGQSVSGVVIVMITYLIISLIIATAMNMLNTRFQLVTR